MVIGIAGISLNDIVVYIADSCRGFDRVYTQRFELQEHHGSGGILSEYLIDSYCDFRPRGELPLGQVLAEDLLGDRILHIAIPFVVGPLAAVGSTCGRLGTIVRQGKSFAQYEYIPESGRYQAQGLGLSRYLIYQDPSSVGCCWWKSVAASNMRAVRRSFGSVNVGASICKPMGRFEAVKPQGMLIAGMPARLAVMV